MLVCVSGNVRLACLLSGFILKYLPPLRALLVCSALAAFSAELAAIVSKDDPEAERKLVGLEDRRQAHWIAAGRKGNTTVLTPQE